MLTRHCISKIYIKLTIYRNDQKVSVSPAHTLLTTAPKSCYILISWRWHLMSVSIKNCHAASEFYGSKHLYSGEHGLIPLPSLHQRQDKQDLNLVNLPFNEKEKFQFDWKFSSCSVKYRGPYSTTSYLKNEFFSDLWSASWNYMLWGFPTLSIAVLKNAMLVKHGYTLIKNALKDRWIFPYNNRMTVNRRALHQKKMTVMKMMMKRSMRTWGPPYRLL